MTWPIQDHCDAFLTLLTTALVSPTLKVFDGAVNEEALRGGGSFDTNPPYALVYFSIETPDGEAAPDWLSLTLASTAINARAIVHSIGGEPQSARASRAIAGRARAAVLDQTLTASGWSCGPVRWIEGQPPQRNEDVAGSTVFDQVDTYGWTATSA